MVSSERMLRGIVDGIYRSAGDPSLWPGTLTMLSDAFGATTTGFAYGRRGGGGGINLFVRSDPEWERLYGEYYSHINPFQRSEHMIREGLVAAGQALCSEHDMRKTEYYADFLKRQDVFHSVAAFPIVRGDTASTVILYRPERRQAFRRHDVALLRQFMPHLALAMRIHDRIASAREQAAVARSLLSALPGGTLVIGADGRVAALNAPAERIVVMNDGLSMKLGHLVATDVAASAHLKMAIASCLAARSDVMSAAGATIFIPRRSAPDRFLRLLVVPLNRVDPGRHAGALIFLSAPGTRTRVDPRLVAHAFGLTRREAELAVALIGGHTPQTVSQQTGVAISTVRTHLKAIFWKTGVHSQSELAALILATPGLHEPADRQMDS